MTDLYFTDRKFNLQGIATTTRSPIMWDERQDVQSLNPETGTSLRTLQGTLHYTRKQNAKIWSMASEGNFVLYQDDYTGDSVFLEITDIEHNPLAGTHEFTANDAGVDLLDETVGEYQAAKAMPIADYIKEFTWDSGWLIGVNEISNLTRTLKWDSTDETVLARIISVATQFDNAELAFRFDYDNTGKKISKYIDIFKHRGSDKPVTLYVNKELNNIVTTGSIMDLYTSVKATGGTPDGKDAAITLKGYKWTDPDGQFVLGDDGILRDTVAVQSWSRVLSNTNTSPTSHHIQRVKTYEATTQATLLQSALADLKAHNAPERSYEADVAILPSGIEVGDTIHLADHDEETYLQTRLLTLTQTDVGATATFGDFVLEHSQISPELQALADSLKKQVAAMQSYPWVRYADDDQGTGISALPADKKYMAVIFADTAEPSDDQADYAGHWALIQGAGEQGAPGKDGVGIKSTTVTYQMGTDGTTAISDDWTESPPDPVKGQYLWTRTVWEYTDGTSQTGYSVAYLAADGAKGDDGIAGKDGVGITKTAITYASATSGTAHPNSGWTATVPTVADGSYLWTKTDWTYSDGTTETGYSVGMMGKQGVTGPTGADGQTTYFHKAYANSLDGKTDFSTTDATDKDYLGTYADQTEAGSTDPTAYTWMSLGGAKAQQALDKVNSLVPAPSSGATYPADPVAGQQFWLAADGSHKPYQYDGTQWVPLTLNAATLDAATFNGMVFNGVTFSGSTFTATNAQDDGSTTVETIDKNGVNIEYQYTDDGEKYYLNSGIDSTGVLYSVLTSDSSSGAPLRTMQISADSLTLNSGELHSNSTGGYLSSNNLSQMNMIGMQLWSGVDQIGKTAVITPTVPLSDCWNGWILIFSQYSGGKATNGSLQLEYVPKSIVETFSGAGTVIKMSSTGNTAAMKYIYVTDVNIKGNEANNASAPNNGYVLREVRAW